MKNIKVAPSILSADFANLEQEIRKIEEFGADWLHFDVMDGHFVPNITFGAPVLKAIKGKTNLLLDVHLMIENPDLYIADFVDAGAEMITVHVEASRHLHRTIQLIKSYGIKAGVVLNPATPLIMIEEILPYVDMVLLMSVNPGFGGQKYIHTTDQKIKTLRQMIDSMNLDTLIQVDGGVNEENAKKLSDLGVDVLVAGSAIFGTKDMKKVIHSMKNPE